MCFKRFKLPPLVQLAVRIFNLHFSRTKFQLLSRQIGARHELEIDLELASTCFHKLDSDRFYILSHGISAQNFRFTCELSLQASMFLLWARKSQVHNLRARDKAVWNKRRRLNQDACV